VKRGGDLLFSEEMATLPLVARHDNVTKFIAFILVGETQQSYIKEEKCFQSAFGDNPLFTLN